MSRRHIVERRVDTCYNIVVFADELRRCRIAVICICGSDLIGQLGHSKNLVSVLIFIRRLHNNIVSGNIRDGHIIDHLVAVLGIGVVDILFYAGRKGGLGVLEHIVCIRRIVFVVIADCRKNRHRHDADKHHYAKN